MIKTDLKQTDKSRGYTLPRNTLPPPILPKGGALYAIIVPTLNKNLSQGVPMSLPAGSNELKCSQHKRIL